MIIQNIVDNLIVYSVFHVDLIFFGVPEMGCVKGAMWSVLRKFNQI